ncbi:SusC/RagA family TonB-linked outer membrane protein [Sphingobacterium sp. MYb382]|uniref:SusC/RagA family TonB-linked outer membrane protein n=1 Tax=Sphingobacterium sp. MYb382 TaxID=2745278 RepID=UPI0030A35D3F
MKRSKYYFKAAGGAFLTLFMGSQLMASTMLQADGFGSVIANMEKKLNVKFSYDASISSRKVSSNIDLNKLNKGNVAQFVANISDDEFVVNKIDDKLYVIAKKTDKGASVVRAAATAVSQQELRGKVVDKATGEAIAGVNVRVLGASQVTNSDASGVFVLNNVPQNATLQFTMVGYNPIEVKSTQVALVQLESSSTALDEVVVTALGIKRDKKALGYATQNISGAELNKVKGVDVGTTLTGRISGVRVRNSTEFNAVPEIQARGLTPILVIDGVLYENMTLREVPVDNIADMNVLKGAAAAALYGERGRGGAIMITTKKGLSEAGTEVNVSTNNMFFSGYLALPKVQQSYSSGEGGKFNNNDFVWGDKLDIGRTAMQWNPFTKQREEMPLVSAGKNNFKNFLVPGFITNNSVSFTNQGEHGSIRTAINHILNKGQYPNQKLNLTNISVTGTTKVGEKVDLETSIGYSRNASSTNFGQGYNDQGYIYNLLVWTGPEYDIRDYQDYWLVKDQSQNWMYNGWYDNPYLIAHEKITPETVNKINAAVTLNYKVTSWGKFILRTGYDYFGSEKTQRNPIGIYGTRGGFDGYGGFNSRGKYQNGKDDGFSSNTDAIFTANKTWGDFNVEGLAGGAILYSLRKGSVFSTVNGLSIPGFYSLTNSIDPISTIQTRRELMSNSVYGRVSLSWRNALFLEATGRNEWASTLAKEQRSYFYPSLSASATLTDLFDFKQSWLDQFKVRGAWVVTKRTANPYDIKTAYTIRNNVWDGLPQATYEANIKDYTISPTQDKSYEFGFDFAILKNRIFGNYTRYYRIRQNEAIFSKVSQMTGFDARLINTKEETMTKGHEITVGGVPIKGEHFRWNVLANMSQNLNYYNKLDPQYSLDALYVKKGMRKDFIVSNDWERSPTGEIVHNASGMPVTGKYAAQLVGYSDPKWFWGLTNQFQYHDFQLSFSIDGRIKGMSSSGINARLWQTGAHPDSDNAFRYEEVVNGNKTYVGQGVKILSGAVAYDKYGQIVEDTRVFANNDQTVSYEAYWKSAWGGRRNLLDETFIKLREVAVNYTVPTAIASKFKASKASIGVTGQNLFLWTKEYKFSDPDVGKEDLNSPSMRYVGFNINLTF